MGCGAAAGAGLCVRTPEPTRRAHQAFDRGDWGWEFLRRNAGYAFDWRASTPRHLRPIALSDGTRLLRMRRRHPRAEMWGLFVFADPSHAAPDAFVAWLPTIDRRVLRARCAFAVAADAGTVVALSAFRAQRSAIIGADGVPVVTMRRQGCRVGLMAHGWHALARRAVVTFEVEGLDELDGGIDSLRTLQRLLNPNARARPAAIPAAVQERLRQALLALDGSLAGASYREIATTIFGDKRVSEEWSAASRFLKDRVRRLVAKGHALMNGGYRDLLR
jgi:hypothetical protein